MSNEDKNVLPLPPKNLRIKVIPMNENLLNNNSSNLNQISRMNTSRESYVDMTSTKQRYEILPPKLNSDENPPPLPIKTRINKIYLKKEKTEVEETSVKENPMCLPEENAMCFIPEENATCLPEENATCLLEENDTFLRNDKNIHIITDQNEKPHDPMIYHYCDEDERTRIESLLQLNKPREDMSRIKSAIIGGSYEVPIPLPTMARSISMNDQIKNKKRNIIMKKLIGKSSSEKEISKKHKSRKENELIFEMFNNPLNESENLPLKSIKFAGMVILDYSKDEDETRVMISDGFIIWNEGKLEKKIRIQHIISIEAMELKNNGYNQHVFEITWWEKQKGTRVQKFIARNLDERSTWMQKILESITSIFPQQLTCQFTRAGWLYVKEGLCGIWTACRILLIDRDIYYCVTPGQVHTSDLRKAKKIEEYKTSELEADCNDEETLVLLELCARTFYLLSVNAQDTEKWRLCFSDAAFRNGPNMNQQQLTKDGVPVIVEMCVSYITMNGSESEGIYRRIDNGLAAQTLLLQFRINAWSVNLIKQNNSVHVVATTLKNYFAELSEPLITMELAPHFRNIAMSGCHQTEKVSRYRELLKQLPEINFVTSKVLFMHLHILHRQSEKNKMDSRLLADAWSSELIRQPTEVRLIKTNVIEDLIFLFPKIYDVTEGEITQELQLQTWKERIYEANEAKKNPTSNEIIMHVQIGDYKSTLDKKVFIGDSKSAGDLCTELASELGMELLRQGFMLLEYIIGGELARPILNTEKVKDVVMRWQNWDVEDRKNNKLVFARCHFYADVMKNVPLQKQLCGELKFADTSKKEFKSYDFEVNRNILTCYKDKKTNNKLAEWKINDLSWYLGFEHSRKPNTKWFITFIDNKNKQNRSKEHPYFGYTIGGGSKEELLTWSYAFFLAAHYNAIKI